MTSISLSWPAEDGLATTTKRRKRCPRSRRRSKALKKSKSTKKVEPSPEEESDPVPSFGAKGRKVGNTPLTPTEEQLLNEYSFTTAVDSAAAAADRNP